MTLTSDKLRCKVEGLCNKGLFLGSKVDNVLYLVQELYGNLDLGDPNRDSLPPFGSLSHQLLACFLACGKRWLCGRYLEACWDGVAMYSSGVGRQSGTW